LKKRRVEHDNENVVVVVGIVEAVLTVLIAGVVNGAVVPVVAVDSDAVVGVVVRGTLVTEDERCRDSRALCIAQKQ